MVPLPVIRIVSLAALGAMLAGLVLALRTGNHDGAGPEVRVTTTVADPVRSTPTSAEATGTVVSVEPDEPVEPVEPVEAIAARLVGHLVPQVVGAFPHDDESFTQGLEWFDGKLLESTGLRGRSTLRLVDPESGVALQLLEVDDDLFAEGVTVVEDRAIQLTWTDESLLVTDLTDTSELAATGIDRQPDAYDGEGWGLCYDDVDLVMSNGSAELAFRDPDTFEIDRVVTVTLDGEPLDRLNELECVHGQVLANIWLSNKIVAIDPATGEVEASIDASSLVPDGVDDRDSVLNGIAYHDETETFWLTGKFWPTMYQVVFVPA